MNAPRRAAKANAFSSPANPAEIGRACPICGRPRVERYAPFCSKRCADVDLHRWLSGGYAIASDEQPADGEAGDDDE